jgi:pyruvate dehydrogenase phosphatase
VLAEDPGFGLACRVKVSPTPHSRTLEMRRAAIQAFRSAARRPCLRKVARSRSAVFTPNNGLVHRAHHHLRPRASPVILSSSMQLRAIGGALVAAAVASGAFYAYNGNQSANSTSPADQARNLSTGANNEPTRKALVVGPDELYTGTITGPGPLAKETDDFGRKVLEMLDAEQTTAKLRKNEESWLVGRGQGVVRYDVVQIPSNDPIEDDHAEKIIEVPSNLAATDGANASDWMFWGVFDGHR